MGASGWVYFAPYEEDLTAVLDELREDVFRSGKYFKLWERYPKILKGGRKPPTTIDEGLELNAESGTHSILDVVDVVDEREAGYVAPIPEDELERFFGTTRPTRDMVDTSEVFELVEDWGRYEGAYFLLYSGDRPTEVCFVGFSGD